VTWTLTGVLLAAAAGLNAFLPLLGLALADRISDSVDLPRPYDVMSSKAGIAMLLVLLTMDLLLDKIPRLDHLNDLIGTTLRPAAGILAVMAVTADRGEIDPVVALLLGMTVAVAVHAYKAMNRIRLATASVSSIRQPMVSLVEDGIAAVVTAIALVFPWAGVVVAALGGAALARAYRIVPNSEAVLNGAAPSAEVMDAPGMNNDVSGGSRAQS
jgi:hypothetical protein